VADAKKRRSGDEHDQVIKFTLVRVTYCVTFACCARRKKEINRDMMTVIDTDNARVLNVRVANLKFNLNYLIVTFSWQTIADASYLTMFEVEFEAVLVLRCYLKLP